jgi:phosphate uptake regulator
MVRRKLVKQGSATYTVSLPKEWVERFNLKSGEDIDLEESGMQLVLSSVNKHKKYETINYNLENIPKELMHKFVVSLYKSGLKDVELNQINNDKAKLAKEVTDHTIGFEILSSDKDKIHITDLGTSDEESLIKAEQQIYWRLLHMIDRIIDKNSKEKEIHDIDFEVNKLSFFIQRNVANKFSNNAKNFMIYEKAAVLESIGDFLRSFKIYSAMSEDDKKYLKAIAEILDMFRAEKSEIEYFVALKKKLESIRSLAEKFKRSNKNNSTLASILLYKNIEQLFDVCLTLNVGNFMEK